MGFFAAVRSAVWTNYFQLNGRASRAEFWWFVLFSHLILAATVLGDMYVIGIDLMCILFSSDPKFSCSVNNFFTWLLWLLTIPTIALFVRRLHDIGRSGYWIWLIFLGLPILSAFGLGYLQLDEAPYLPTFWEAIMISSTVVAQILMLPLAMIYHYLLLPVLLDVLGLRSDMNEYLAFSLFAPLLAIILGLINSQLHDNQYGPVPPHKRPQTAPAEDASKLNESPAAAAGSPEADSSGTKST